MLNAGQSERQCEVECLTIAGSHSLLLTMVAFKRSVAQEVSVKKTVRALRAGRRGARDYWEEWEWKSEGSGEPGVV